MNNKIVFGHMIVLVAILVSGVLLHTNGLAGGILFDCLMYVLLAGFSVQFLLVAAGDRITGVPLSKLADRMSFSLWVGVAYAFIMMRDTDIGLVYSLLIIIPGIFMGLILISMIQFLLKRVGF